MAVVCDQYNNVCVITVVGELTGDDAGAFSQLVEDELRRRAASAFVVDLRDCECIDRAGADSLLRASRRCKDQGRHFGLANVDPNCRQTLEMTAATTRFDFHHDLATALKTAAPAGANRRPRRGLQSGQRPG